MSDVGKLCYKHGDGRLTFKRGDGSLIYKANPCEYVWTTITFKWTSDGTDLDICGYWLDAPDIVAGYSHGLYGGREYQSGGFYIIWSGDIRSTGSSEWCKVRCPHKIGTCVFRVHFRYFQSCKADTCSVVANETTFKTCFKHNQRCSAAGSTSAPATKSDPYADVIFVDGKLDRIE